MGVEVDVPRSSYDVTYGGLITCKLFLGFLEKLVF